jgi:fucose permease
VLCGVGVSVQFPMCLALLIEASDGRPDQATARGALWAGAGTGVGPFLLGALADGFGSHQAFLIVPVLIGFSVAGVLASR